MSTDWITSLFSQFFFWKYQIKSSVNISWFKIATIYNIYHFLIRKLKETSLDLASECLKTFFSIEVNYCLYFETQSHVLVSILPQLVDVLWPLDKRGSDYACWLWLFVLYHPFAEKFRPLWLPCTIRSHEHSLEYYCC